MNIYRNGEGAIIVADIVTDGCDTWRECRTFYGYTRAQAITLYREHLLQKKYTIAPEY